jgi:adenosylcobinamide kinase/adenosylcobinamide-phosphate guanylyltransferase
VLEEGNMTKRLILVLGGARSGKSFYASEIAKSFGGPVTYVATGNSSDPEMRRRIEKHKQLRPKEWETIEAGKDVIPALREADKRRGLIILDCLTLFVSHLLEQMELAEEIIEDRLEVEIMKRINELVEALKKLKSQVIVVSNEVGLGIVPPFPAGRLFRDVAGWANQKVAEAADEVYFMTAGIPIQIKNQISKIKNTYQKPKNKLKNKPKTKHTIKNQISKIKNANKKYKN